MSLRRQYLAVMPTDAGNMPYLDILVEGPVGSINNLVAIGATATGSVPPAGWQSGPDFASAPSGQGDGAFCEWASRTLRVPSHFGDTNDAGDSTFCPLLRNGFSVSVITAGRADGGVFCGGIQPALNLSESLVGQLPGTVSDLLIEDQTYGTRQQAVIRLWNSPDVAGKMFVVSFEVQTDLDRDRV